MKSYVDNVSERTNRSSAATRTDNQLTARALPFAINRPEITQTKALQDKANSSSRIKPLDHYQKLARQHGGQTARPIQRRIKLWGETLNKENFEKSDSRDTIVQGLRSEAVKQHVDPDKILNQLYKSVYGDEVEVEADSIGALFERLHMKGIETGLFFQKGKRDKLEDTKPEIPGTKIEEPETNYRIKGATHGCESAQLDQILLKPKQGSLGITYHGHLVYHLGGKYPESGKPLWCVIGEKIHIIGRFRHGASNKIYKKIEGLAGKKEFHIDQIGEIHETQSGID